MSRLRFHISEVSYGDHPWFGPESLLHRLSLGELDSAFPLFSPDREGPVSSSPGLNRLKLADSLAGANRSLGHPLDAQSLHKLRGEGRLILAGHQPVLLTGPLFTFLKAVTIVSLARSLSDRTGSPHLPAIWIATEDHDLLEVNRTFLRGQRIVVEPAGDLRSGRMPEVGRVSLQERREEIMAALEKALPKNDFREGILETVRSASFDTYGTQFASLLSALFPDAPLVFIDPRKLREITGPVLAQAVEQWPDLTAAFSRGREILLEAGFTPPLSDLSLFEIREGFRVKCTAHPDGFDLSTGRAGFSEASAEIRRRPEDFSPGAGLRPLLQDAVLPVSAYVGGQAELLYGWQIDPLYDVLGIQRSRLFPRISATFVDRKTRKAADRAGLSGAELLSAAVLLAQPPGDREEISAFEPLRKLTDSLLEELEGLETPANRSWLSRGRSGIEKQMDRLLQRLHDEELRKAGRGRKDLEKIAQAVLPGSLPQERRVNLFHFISYYGPEFMKRALESLSPNRPVHQIVEIDPEERRTPS